MNKILLVDDETDFLQLVEAILTKDGYSVVLAETSADALELARSGVGFDLALVDFWLNGEQAIKLIETLVECLPETPIILMSGGGFGLPIEASNAISQISGTRGFLQKPIRREALLRAVEGFLTASQG